MRNEIPTTMIGMKLPGGAKVQRVEQEIPKPGPGQVLRQPLIAPEAVSEDIVVWKLQECGGRSYFLESRER